jgi:hypothetical protein
MRRREVATQPNSLRLKILPLVQLDLLDRVDVWQERFQRFRMSLEEVEEGDGAHGFRREPDFAP